MRVVTPQQLCQSYQALYPGEITDPVDGARILGNWLERYCAYPDRAVAAEGNWHGKVTAALFHVVGMKLPRTKRERLFQLDRRNPGHELHVQPTGPVWGRSNGWFAQCSGCTWSYAPMDQNLVGLGHALEIHGVHLTQMAIIREVHE